jgi:hypothetical protein
MGQKQFHRLIRICRWRGALMKRIRKLCKPYLVGNCGQWIARLTRSINLKIQKIWGIWERRYMQVIIFICTWKLGNLGNLRKKIYASNHIYMHLLIKFQIECSLNECLMKNCCLDVRGCNKDFGSLIVSIIFIIFMEYVRNLQKCPIRT